MKVYVCLLGCVLLAACSGSEKLASKKETANSRKAVCEGTLVSSKPHIDWYKEKKAVLKKSDRALVLPAEYEVYTADQAEVKAFFESVSKDAPSETLIPTAEANSCIKVTVSLDKRSGNYITLKSIDPDMQANLDYNGVVMQGFVSRSGITHKILPEIIEGNVYYIIYKSAEQNVLPEVKQPTEGKVLEYRYDK